LSIGLNGRSQRKQEDAKCLYKAISEILFSGISHPNITIM